VPLGVLCKELLFPSVYVGEGSPILLQRKLRGQLQRGRFQLPGASLFQAFRFTLSHDPQLRT
jgi:hypothetical protein